MGFGKGSTLVEPLSPLKLVALAPEVGSLPSKRAFPQPARLVSVALANEVCNSGVSLRQCCLVGQEDDAEMLRAGLLAEAGAVHDHDVLLPDEFLHKNFVALGYVDSGVSIKSSARRNATHARRRLAPFLREIAARPQLAFHFNEMILRAFECLLDRILLRMVGAQSCAQQAVHTFAIGLHRDRIAGDDAPPDPPSRNQIVLRH